MEHIKVNKNNKSNFYNVPSSYNHLIENHNQGHKSKNYYLFNSFYNFTLQKNNQKNKEPKSSSKGKSIITTSSLDIIQKSNNTTHYTNQRLKTDISYSKRRDTSPVLCSSIKMTSNQMNNSKNKPSNYLNMNNIKNFQFILRNINRNNSGKKAKNINENSGNYEVCLTEPGKKNRTDERNAIVKKRILTASSKRDSRNSKSAVRGKKSTTPQSTHKGIKVNINTTIPNNRAFIRRELKHKSLYSNIKKTSPIKKDDKINKVLLNEINQYNTYKDLNININTNINITSPVNTLIQENYQRTNKDQHLNEPEVIPINSIFSNKDIMIHLSYLNQNFSNYFQAKCSTKNTGCIKAYGVNTYQGLIRNYNEDRVSIILNISKPPTYQLQWPKCSLFGIYDGHGGSSCADFLRDKLHTFIIKDPNFPLNPQKALLKGFEKAEEYFLSNISTRRDKINNTNILNLIDKSGSCAIVVLIIENKCYIANVGDSRAILSLHKGKGIKVLTTDHKPNEEGESLRIISNGGKIYQTQTPTKFIQCIDNNISDNNNINIINNRIVSQILIGPYRVFPGRLSVSRTIGDAEAKMEEFGGIKGVVIGEPDITSFTIDDNVDFLMIGCDGIFDQLDNEEIAKCVWMTCEVGNAYSDAKNVHEQCRDGVDMIMKSALMRKTLDNITVVIIAFKSFEEEVEKKIEMEMGELLEREYLQTEPEYNFQHERIRMSSGLRNDDGENKGKFEIGEKGGNIRGKESGSSENILKKKICGKRKNIINVNWAFSPKINMKQRWKFMRKGK